MQSPVLEMQFQNGQVVLSKESGDFGNPFLASPLCIITLKLPLLPFRLLQHAVRATGTTTPATATDARTARTRLIIVATSTTTTITNPTIEPVQQIGVRLSRTSSDQDVTRAHGPSGREGARERSFARDVG
jgi:hypothetical protein